MMAACIADEITKYVVGSTVRAELRLIVESGTGEGPVVELPAKFGKMYLMEKNVTCNNFESAYYKMDFVYSGWIENLAEFIKNFEQPEDSVPEKIAEKPVQPIVAYRDIDLEEF